MWPHPLNSPTVPPYPLDGKSFCFSKKPLAERGGTPLPPLNGQSPKIFLKKMGQKGVTLAFFGQKIAIFSGFFP